jgi:hypothetical protein
MALQTLTATDRRNGEWDFSCPLHEPVLEFRTVSGTNNAISILKTHMDEDHQGIKVRIHIVTDHHIHTTYTGTENVPTGDLL